MSHVASVRVSVVTAVLDEFVRRGGDGAAMRVRFGLDALGGDPYAIVPMVRYVAMFEEMARLIDDPLFGARMGVALKPVDLGPAGLLIARSASIQAALRRMTDYVNSFQSATQSHLSTADGLTLWTYRLGDTALWPRRQDAEFTMTSLVQLLRAGFERSWKPYAVHFEHPSPPPAHRDALSRMLGAPVNFDAATNAMLLDAADAARAHRREDADLVAVLERYLQDLGVPFRTEGSWRERVLALIASGLGQNLGQNPGRHGAGLERLAADLGVAPRSLQRRLADEGTSLRELLNEHRAEIAGRQLSGGTVSISSLAETLGYGDGTAFWRAHRRWIGESPSARRKAARQRQGEA